MSVSLTPQVVPSLAFSRYSLAVGPCSRHPVTSVGVLDAECDAGLAYIAIDPRVPKNIAAVIPKLSVAFMVNLLEAAPRWCRPRSNVLQVRYPSLRQRDGTRFLISSLQL